MEKVASPIGIGSDLELFLYDNKKGKIVPCVGILEGTKDEPFRPEGYGPGFAIQEDNVMVEYNIPPATTVSSFVKFMRKGQMMVLHELEKRYGTQYSLYTRRHTHRFSARELTSRQAKLIGCEPDQDAYEGGAHRLHPPAPGLDRACGGHIHLGGDFKCPDFVAALFAELFLGVRGGLAAKVTDPRAKWYGKPGIFRSKPYGIEYRTPHNGWAANVNSMEMVGDLGIRCARYLTETDSVKLQQAFRKIPWVQVREYMLENKRTEAAAESHHQLMRLATKAGVPL